MAFILETVRKISNDEDNTIYEIGHDCDGLGCVEIRYLDEDRKITERMTFPPFLAHLIANVIEKCANEVSLKGNSH